MVNFLNFNIVEVGLFVVAAAYVITYYLKGGTAASTEVINALKEQHSINAGKINDLVKEVGVLTGQLKEKEERIKVLEALVQGRSPEQTQYMADMRQFTEEVAKYMNSSTQSQMATTTTLGEISIFMQNLNKQ